MRKLGWLLVAWYSTLLAACHGLPALAATDGRFAWASFDTPRQTFDHAALLVPIMLDGVSCTAQLDTGANYAFKDRQLDTGAASSQTVTLSLDNPGNLKAAVTLSAASMASVARHDCANIGRVGNALFDHGSLVLDLQNSRYAWYAHSVLADDARAEHLVYHRPDGWEGGYLIVDYRLEDGATGSAYLDTGAALFTIAPVDDATLATLAGDGLQTIAVPSAGQSVACRIGPLSGALWIGTRPVTGGLAGTCHKLLPDVGRHVSAVVGLGGFAGKRLTIDYVAQKWQVD